MNEIKFPLLRRITIIIPTYNRQEFALRCLHYWSGKEVKVIIVDGSKESLSIIYLKKLKKNIKYLHSQTNFKRRLLLAVALVKTEYVKICHDDEFFFPSALNSCIYKMSTMADLSACFGKTLAFNWEKNSVVGYDQYILQEKKILNLNEPNSRIKKHFKNFEIASFFGIHRSNFFKIYINTLNLKCHSQLFEISCELLSCYAGKILYIPELLNLRSYENPTIIKETNTLGKWWFSKKNIKQKNQFIACIKKATQKINKINKTHFSLDVKNAIDYFIKFNESRYLDFYYSFILPILRILPKSLKELLKKIIKFVFNRSEKKLLIDKAMFIEKEGTKVDLKELKKIIQLIEFFYKSKKYLMQ